MRWCLKSNFCGVIFVMRSMIRWSVILNFCCVIIFFVCCVLSRCLIIISRIVELDDRLCGLMICMKECWNVLSVEWRFFWDVWRLSFFFWIIVWFKWWIFCFRFWLSFRMFVENMKISCWIFFVRNVCILFVEIVLC